MRGIGGGGGEGVREWEGMCRPIDDQVPNGDRSTFSV